VRMSRMEVPDNIHVTIGWRRQVLYCRPGVSFLSPDLYSIIDILL